MLDDNDGVACGAQVGDEFLQFIHGLGIEVGEWLVK
jgi:hypothetical protein